MLTRNTLFVVLVACLLGCALATAANHHDPSRRDPGPVHEPAPPPPPPHHDIDRKCKRYCPERVRPICACKGPRCKTFRNMCKFEEARCREGPRLRFKHRGRCRRRPRPHPYDDPRRHDRDRGRDRGGDRDRIRAEDREEERGEEMGEEMGEDRSRDRGDDRAREEGGGEDRNRE